MEASGRSTANGGVAILTLTWVRGLLHRRPGRLLGLASGVMMTVLLTASLGAFFAASRARMTVQAAASVPVDMQVQLKPGTDLAHARTIIAAAPGVAASLPVGYADVSGFQSTAGGAVQTTGPGKVLGLPPGYDATFPGEIRYLLGSHDGVLLAQQTAANLGATVGSTVTVRLAGRAPLSYVVAGVVDLPAADSMFQSIGAAPGSAATAPPDNVMLLPGYLWQKDFGAAGTVGAITQLHVKLGSGLPSDPGAAFAQVIGRAKNIEATLAGTGLIGNNLAARLDAARSDAIYSQLLFLFLGLPGIVLAWMLTVVAASAGRDRRRREQALLRIRGASPRRIVTLATAEAMVAAIAGVTLGLLGATLVGRLAFGSTRFGATGTQAIAWAAASAMIGMALTMVAVVLPAYRDSRTLSVRSEQVAIGHQRQPLWARFYLDIVLLTAGGLIFWQAVKSGYQVVLAPEGVPTISVGYFTLMAPALFWIGAALLTWRLSDGALVRLRTLLARLVRPYAHGLSSVVAASMSRRHRAISRGTVLVALTASFALSIAIFNTTYQVQAKVDARLTNGADVSVSIATLKGLPATLPATVQGLPGVAAVESMQHRFAYVGNDLQDLYGINPATIGRATSMSDAFFAGGDARSVLANLAAHPDGVLLSLETVRDFQLQPGDLVRLRMQLASDGKYHVVPFHYVGIAREFPTAPHDSFIVANASYVAQQTGTAAVQTLLIRTDGSPPAVAAAVRQAIGPASGATVQDILTEQRITLSALTAIDLAGLTRLELSFALALAVGASGLVLALGLAERRRTFAIAIALGAKRRQLASFVWSEATFVTAAGLLLGASAGWGIAQVIVKILTGVFDPPPEHLSVPWGYLAIVGVVTLGAVVFAGMAVLRAIRGRVLEVLRDL